MAFRSDLPELVISAPHFYRITFKIDLSVFFDCVQFNTETICSRLVSRVLLDGNVSPTGFNFH